MEAEARSILGEAVASERDQPGPNLAEAIRRRFAPLGGVDLIQRCWLGDTSPMTVADIINHT
jgi:hypothetical protein